MARCIVSTEDPAVSALRRIRAAVRSGVTPKPRKPTRVLGKAGRDPLMVGEAVRDFLVANGLDQRQQVARVLEGWAGLVGEDVAAHVVVEGFDEGNLLLRADSTAWANQMRLLRATLERRLTDELGEGAVATITVLGPDAPSWRFGSRRVPGRGPRDTYG